jgi:hypothetical protein
MRRRKFVTLLASAALVGPPSARTQQTARVAKIGFLGAASLGAYAERVLAFQRGLRDLGFDGTHDGRTQVKKNNEATRLWVSGIEALKRKIGVINAIGLMVS